MAGYTVGVDVGGTKILAAVVAPDESIVARAKIESPSDTSEALMQAVYRAIGEALAKAGATIAEVDAIGLGVPGVVGPDGTCIWAPNCPLSGVPVAALVSAEFGVPAAVGNDVNCGTLGEKAFGAAREFDDVFGMFVGTGIGGGLVIGGRVVIGDHCLGAEVGHIIINHTAALAGEEGGGEFEYYASRLGIERRLRAAVAAGRETIVADQVEADDERIKSGRLRKALEAGDAVVSEVLTDVSRILGVGCVTVIHLCDPQAIILGGGVIEACGEFMVPLIEETIAHHVAPGNGQPIRVVRSQLGDDAVLLGAVALARGLDPAEAGGYPTILAGDFGQAFVNGEAWDRDIVVRAGGQLKKRKKRLSREVHGTSHEVSVEEIKYVCKGTPERLIIGCGHHRQLQLSRNAAKWLEAQGVSYVLLPTPEAAGAFNHAAGPKALLLHLTC